MISLSNTYDNPLKMMMIIYTNDIVRILYDNQLSTLPQSALTGLANLQMM